MGIFRGESGYFYFGCVRVISVVEFFFEERLEIIVGRLIINSVLYGVAFKCFWILGRRIKVLSILNFFLFRSRGGVRFFLGLRVFEV